jgi:hypothetical protein
MVHITVVVNIWRRFAHYGPHFPAVYVAIKLEEVRSSGQGDITISRGA